MLRDMAAWLGGIQPRRVSHEETDIIIGAVSGSASDQVMSEYRGLERI